MRVSIARYCLDLMSNLNVFLIALALVTGAVASFAIFRGLRASRRRVTADTDFSPRARAKDAPPSQVLGRLDRRSWVNSESSEDAAPLGADEKAKKEPKDKQQEIEVDSVLDRAPLIPQARVSEPTGGVVAFSSDPKEDADLWAEIKNAKQDAKSQEIETIDKSEEDSMDMRLVRDPVGKEELIATSNSPGLIPSRADLSVDWCEDYVEIEAGLGVVCAKSNSYDDPVFKSAQDLLRQEYGLFLMNKGKSVQAKECAFVLAARLSDLGDNAKIQDAYAMGVPVVLAEDVLSCEYGNPVKAFLSKGCLEKYQALRKKFEDNWQLVSLTVESEMKYFLTQSNADGKLAVIEAAEEYLDQVIGAKLELGSSVPQKIAVDMVVVPTLKSTSTKYAQVLKRKQPPLVVKTADLESVKLGDQVPAWRWRGGAYFQYPPLDRKF